eukprot:8555221-Ditylum_brightwellii.AAC.1
MKRFLEEATALRNMLIVLWKAFVHQIKITMQTVLTTTRQMTQPCVATSSISIQALLCWSSGPTNHPLTTY